MRIMMLTVFFFVMTIAVYVVMNFFYVKYRRSFLIPILTSTVTMIVILLLFKVPYATYMIGGKWLDILLGPAIVALAIPLFKQQDMLKKNVLSIIGGVLMGVVVGMTSGVLFAKLFGFSQDIILSLLPKSITTPIAIQITAAVGGISSLATVFVMIAGFTGVIFGPMFFKWTRMDKAMGRGIGLGAAAHALGTSKALELGEQEASMSSVAMTLCAIIGSIVGPVIVWIFY
ncbi:LrgB family protein [Sporosarcina sp. YIM B06819]|uniref:LrgB family protein n=1 Tax=Sporosarcina sp. YIM B06819 TaxID=3081769 RepID=UPI00298D340D|nr:LrgB family protein [Sporosarcina sp. YIM B06819]